MQQGFYQGFNWRFKCGFSLLGNFLDQTVSNSPNSGTKWKRTKMTQGFFFLALWNLHIRVCSVAWKLPTSSVKKTCLNDISTWRSSNLWGQSVKSHEKIAIPNTIRVFLCSVGIHLIIKCVHWDHLCVSLFNLHFYHISFLPQKKESAYDSLWCESNVMTEVSNNYSRQWQHHSPF